MQHTSGPWHFVPSSDARIPDRITNAAGSNIVSGSIGFDPDARLIAASPDLLDAAQQAVRLLEQSGFARYPQTSRVLKALNAAIART